MRKVSVTAAALSAALVLGACGGPSLSAVERRWSSTVGSSAPASSVRCAARAMEHDAKPGPLAKWAPGKISGSESRSEDPEALLQVAAHCGL